MSFGWYVGLFAFAVIGWSVAAGFSSDERLGTLVALLYVALCVAIVLNIFNPTHLLELWR